MKLPFFTFSIKCAQFFFLIPSININLPIPCSVSSLMTTTEAIVVELPKDDKEAPAMGGGMGGMGMDY